MFDRRFIYDYNWAHGLGGVRRIGRFQVIALE